MPGVSFKGENIYLASPHAAGVVLSAVSMPNVVNIISVIEEKQGE